MDRGYLTFAVYYGAFDAVILRTDYSKAKPGRYHLSGHESCQKGYGDMQERRLFRRYFYLYGNMDCKMQSGNKTVEGCFGMHSIDALVLYGGVVFVAYRFRAGEGYVSDVTSDGLLFDDACAAHRSQMEYGFLKENEHQYLSGAHGIQISIQEIDWRRQ